MVIPNTENIPISPTIDWCDCGMMSRPGRVILSLFLLQAQPSTPPWTCLYYPPSWTYPRCPWSPLNWNENVGEGGVGCDGDGGGGRQGGSSGGDGIPLPCSAFCSSNEATAPFPSNLPTGTRNVSIILSCILIVLFYLYLSLTILSCPSSFTSPSSLSLKLGSWAASEFLCGKSANILHWCSWPLRQEDDKFDGET